jgi:hypothetical protein
MTAGSGDDRARPAPADADRAAEPSGAAALRERYADYVVDADEVAAAIVARLLTGRGW